MTGFDIGNRHVGNGAPAFIMAEVGQAHDGSFGNAHAYIDAIAKTGADAVKFQCHIADAESWPDEPWRVVPEWPQDKTRFDYWRRMEFSRDQWWSLAAHTRAKGLEFLCSPFSVEAVRILDPLVDAWKVPSGEVHPGRVMDALFNSNSRDGKPVLVSHGMSTTEDIVWSLGFHPMALLHCVSMYPPPPVKIGLPMLNDWRQSYACPVGLSDHSGTIYAGLAAVALGCDILEVHVCWSKEQFGFDTAASITIEDLRHLVEGVRFIEKAKRPVDKDALAKELQPMRELFMGRHERVPHRGGEAVLAGVLAHQRGDK